METKKAIQEYRLPHRGLAEDIACRWTYTMVYGKSIILAGHHYTGPGKPNFFGAIYQQETNDPEGYVSLIRASEVEFYDAGHAIEWCINNID